MQSPIRTSLITAACVAIMVTAAMAAQMLSVQVRSGQLRDKPGFLSKIVAEIPYGDQVDLKTEKGDWRKVTSDKTGKTGWMHASALTEKEIILSPTNADVDAAANSDELALAGKGFNKQVEEEYQAETHLDYSQVDKMESYEVPPTAVQTFMKDGGLGGAK